MMSSRPHKLLQNQTGTSLAPDPLERWCRGRRNFLLPETGTASSRCVDYARGAEPVGSFPPPGNAERFQQAAARAPNQQLMDTFMDKLGARLAFERNGVRFV